MSANMSEQKYLEACPLGCESELFDSEILLPEGCLKVCSECGQFFSQCSEKFFYESMEEFNVPQGTWPPPENTQRLTRNTDKLLKKIEWISAKKRDQIKLLDVGCSSGAFINSAGLMGVEAEGVEPAREASDAAVKAGLKVYNGFLSEVGLSSRSYDVITMFEVIEHVKDPVELLKECNRLLRDQGLLVVKTANSNSWTVAFQNGGWEYFSIKAHGGHISFFNKKSINVLAERSGFRVVNYKTQSVTICDKEKSPYLVYRFFRIFSELMNLPAKILGRGQEMEVVLMKTGKDSRV